MSKRLNLRLMYAFLSPQIHNTLADVPTLATQLCTVQCVCVYLGVCLCGCPEVFKHSLQCLYCLWVGRNCRHRMHGHHYVYMTATVKIY